MPAGFVRTTLNPAPFVVSSGTNVAGVTFGNFRLISIGGNKFQDTNGNGVQNVGELGLAGVTIFLDADNDGLLDIGERSTTSDVNGNYTFTNVGPGTYTVREVVPAGFVQTTLNPPAIIASSGTNIAGVAFGNRSVSIGGYKFQDTNGNGVRDLGEQGLQGFTIYIDADSDGVLDIGEARTTTGANGNFGFSNLPPGTYRVREVGQINFVQMTNDPADIVLTINGGRTSTVLFGNIPVANLAVVSKLLFTGRNLTNLLNGTFGRQANFVANLYQNSALDRAPTLNELTYYLRLLMAGYTQEQITAMFRVDYRL
ncbi:MAG: SdrD B-like domain-containing protein [Planctomycetota bacterium]